jgi:hypothetical protein
MNLDLHDLLARRSVRIAICAAVCVLSVLRFVYLTADFPNWSPWMIDQAKFTDEGWWAGAAVMHVLTGRWYVAGDYNPAVALPVWPILLSVVFHFTGVSLVAARALNGVISIATLGVVFILVRRFTGMRAKQAAGEIETSGEFGEKRSSGAKARVDSAGSVRGLKPPPPSGSSFYAAREAPALLAVLLLSASPFAFVFNRLAILDTLVVFEFCLLLLVASCALVKRIWPLAVLTLLVTTMLLTKTTSALLVPAVFWVAWSAMGRKPGGLLRAFATVGVLPAVLLKSYAALASALGYGADYRYFFGVNAMPDIAWRQSFATLSDLFQNGFWIDRVLYPIGLLILVLTMAWKRKLWSNPLFAASWIAIAAQAVFIFSRQDDYAPRYFLVMLAPLVWIIILTLGELMIHARKAVVLLLIAMGASLVANAAMIRQFLTHRDYDFHNAALSIRGIIRSHPEQKALILGASGAQISLMTGIPSIDDGYGTEDLAEKVARYQPGWYVAWNDMTAENEPFLSTYRLEKVAGYPAFDDDDRNVLILYRMVRRGGNPSAPSVR